MSYALIQRTSAVNEFLNSREFPNDPENEGNFIYISL